MIRVKTSGNFNNVQQYLNKAKDKDFNTLMDRYGKIGVDRLSAATPTDTGQTASLWRYEVERGKTHAKLIFHNDNVNHGVNIAIILQYGHGTGTGGWVEGRDYINPAIQPLFDELAENVWKEASRL